MVFSRHPSLEVLVFSIAVSQGMTSVGVIDSDRPFPAMAAGGSRREFAYRDGSLISGARSR